MNNKEQTEFEKKVLDQFMPGKSLFGKYGAFAPMLKNVIEKVLSAEMESHLDTHERLQGNKRNDSSMNTKENPKDFIGFGSCLDFFEVINEYHKKTDNQYYC